MNNTSLINALTAKTIQTRNESVSKQLNTESAMDVRDALVKAVYGRMFIWLIDKINVAIYKVNRDPRHVRKSIGVLDIFGFENFDSNRWVHGLMAGTVCTPRNDSVPPPLTLETFKCRLKG